MIKHSTVFQPRTIRIVEIIFLSFFIISLFFPYVWGVFQPRIIRIVEIVFLSLFIISLFIPYAYGVKPKVYFWDIWSSDGGWSSDGSIWTQFFIVGLPLILSFFLFILKFGKFKFGKLTISLIQWSALIIYAFIMVLFLIEEVRSYIDSEIFRPTEISIILTLVFSLFLIVLSIVKAKDNYLKLENYILSIIAIPVVSYFFWLLQFEFGGYLLNICFAVLYVIAVLKVFLLKKNEENPTA